MNQTTCQEPMHGGHPCRRPVVINHTKCILHYDSAAKDIRRFEREIDSLIENAKQSYLDLTGVVFPKSPFDALRSVEGDIYLDRAKFMTSITFQETTFGGTASFEKTKFIGDADFTRVHFCKDAIFVGSSFSGLTVFADTTFDGRALFGEATFGNKCSFYNADFGNLAAFTRTKFKEILDFRNSMLANGVTFHGAEFEGEVDFRLTEFKARLERVQAEDEISFAYTKFHKSVDFGHIKDAFFRQVHSDWRTGLRADHGTIFNGKCNFTGTQFVGRCNFSRTIFWNDVKFKNVKFQEQTVFEDTQFFGHALFYEASFVKDVTFDSALIWESADFGQSTFGDTVRFKALELAPGGNFSLDYIIVENLIEVWGIKFPHEVSLRKAHIRGWAKFGELQFDRIGLFQNIVFGDPSQVSIANSDLSNVSFRETDVSKIRFYRVTWNDKVSPFRSRWYTKPIEFKRAKIIDETDPDLHEPAAHLYRDLQLNYVRSGDYRTAGDFFVGEREMIRKAAGKFRQYFSFDFAYKLASFYGQSVSLPMIWLFLILLISPFLLMIFPLDAALGAEVQTIPGYEWSWRISDIVLFKADYWEMFRANLSFVTRTSTSVYPAGSWQLLVIAFETILAVICVTFFLLALRRRFKRKSF